MRTPTKLLVEPCQTPGVQPRGQASPEQPLQIGGEDGARTPPEPETQLSGFLPLDKFCELLPPDFQWEMEPSKPISPAHWASGAGACCLKGRGGLKDWPKAQSRTQRCLTLGKQTHCGTLASNSEGRDGFKGSPRPQSRDCGHTLGPCPSVALPGNSHLCLWGETGSSTPPKPRVGALAAWVLDLPQSFLRATDH